MAFLFTIPVTALSLYLTALTAYLLVIAVAAYLFRKKADYAAGPLKLAVVIPAHNEEVRIAGTVGSVLQSDYEASRYAVFVIADNCDDRTAERAERAGARIFRRVDPARRGKGQALDWFFRTQQSAYSAFDAVVLIDADTWVDKAFLREIAASLQHREVAVVQGYYGVANAGAAWRSGLLSAAFHVFNHLRPAGHERLGGTAGLRGNGMGFRKELLSGGWPAHSIVEDYELSLRLLLAGVLVRYNPDALVYSDMPTDRKVAETQRMRWEGMSRGMRHTFTGLIFKKLIHEPRLCYLDALVDSFVPPLATLVLGQALLFIAALALGSWLVVPLGCSLLADVFYVLSGLVLRKAGRAEWRSLLTAPFYILWKIPVYLKMRHQDTTVWRRTERKSEQL